MTGPPAVSPGGPDLHVSDNSVGSMICYALASNWRENGRIVGSGLVLAGFIAPNMVAKSLHIIGRNTIRNRILEMIRRRAKYTVLSK
jgi:hypothetical protein